MASRLDFSQIRSLYIGTSASQTVPTNNVIIDGNVLLGTTTDTGLKLDVNGSARLSGGLLYLGNYSANPEIILQSANNSWSKINFYDNNNTEGLYIRTDGTSYGGTMTLGSRWDDDEGKVFFKMFQSSAGAAYDVKIGVNTGSPESMLHLDKSSSANDISNTPSIIISNKDSTSGTFVGGGIFNNPYRDVSTSSVTAGVWFENQNSPDAGAAAKSSAVVFGANSYSANWALPTERMRITQGGLVGIGTSDPLAKLHVSNGVPSGVGTLPANTTLLVDNGASNNFITIRNTVDNGTYGGFIFQDNNVGGYIAFRNYTGSGPNDGSNGDAMYYGTYTDHIFQAGTQEPVGTKPEIMRIKYTGNVLIGTSTDPGTKLYVYGSIRLGAGGSNDKIDLMHGNGVGDYGAIRFYEGGVERQTIHSFCRAWQNGTIYSASSGSININGDYGVTFGVWYDPDVVINTAGVSYFRNNVLLGTTTDSGYRLRVNGNSYIDNNLTVAGTLYGTTISSARYIRYNFNGTNFVVGASTATRWVIGRIYWNQYHWGNYSGMDIEIVWNYYNGARKRYSIGNGAAGGSLYLRESQSYGSAYARITLGSAVATGTTSGGYPDYYQDVYLEVNEYNQVSVNGELKGPQVGIDKTSITSGEYGYATFFSSPSASTISTFSSTAATVLSSEGNWGYIDNKLGINVANPSYELDVYAATTPVIRLSSNNSSGVGNPIFIMARGGEETFKLAVEPNVGAIFRTVVANAGYMDFYTGTDSLTLRMSGNKNVLIGTSTDSGYKLDVNGTGRFAVVRSNYYDIPSGTGFNSFQMGADSSAGGWYVYNLTTGTYNFVVSNGGNIGIGNTGPSYKLDVSGTIRATGDVIAYSDARVKENVETIDGALDKVLKMRGVSYNKIGEQEKKVGVIAQEILEVLPEVVSQDYTGTYSVAYGNIVSVLIEAIKELSEKVDAQQTEIDQLKKLIK